MTYLKNFINDEEGQDLVEYALLLGFLAIGATVALTALSGKISGMFSKVGTALT